MSSGQIGYILWSSFLLVQMPYVSPLQLEHIIFDTQHVTVGKNGQIGYIPCCCGFMVSGFVLVFVQILIALAKLVPKKLTLQEQS